jgi:hypothetical protein
MLRHNRYRNLNSSATVRCYRRAAYLVMGCSPAAGLRADDYSDGKGPGGRLPAGACSFSPLRVRFYRKRAPEAARPNP